MSENYYNNQSLRDIVTKKEFAPEGIVMIDNVPTLLKQIMAPVIGEEGKVYRRDQIDMCRIVSAIVFKDGLYCKGQYEWIKGSDTLQSMLTCDPFKRVKKWEICDPPWIVIDPPSGHPDFKAPSHPNSPPPNHSCISPESPPPVP